MSGETPTLAIRWKIRGFARAAAIVHRVHDGRPRDGGRRRGRDGRPGHLLRHHHAVSEHWRIVQLPGGGSRLPGPDPEHCYAGRRRDARLRDAFLGSTPTSSSRLFRETGTCWDDYAVVCAHQVTVPFIEDLVTKVGLPLERLVLTVAGYGNVSSGSLPLALALAREDGRVRRGDRVLWIGLGAGISVATMAFVL